MVMVLIVMVVVVMVVLVVVMVLVVVVVMMVVAGSWQWLKRIPFKALGNMVGSTLFFISMLCLLHNFYANIFLCLTTQF